MIDYLNEQIFTFCLLPMLLVCVPVSVCVRDKSCVRSIFSFLHAFPTKIDNKKETSDSITFLLKLRVKVVVLRIQHQSYSWRVNVHLGKQPLGCAVHRTLLIKLRIRSITSCVRFIRESIA